MLPQNHFGKYFLESPAYDSLYFAVFFQDNTVPIESAPKCLRQTTTLICVTRFVSVPVDVRRERKREGCFVNPFCWPSRQDILMNRNLVASACEDTVEHIDHFCDMVWGVSTRSGTLTGSTFYTTVPIYSDRLTRSTHFIISLQWHPQ